MSSPIPPLPPVDGDDGATDAQGQDITVDVDGDTVLDPDANDELIDSAEADRVAAEEGEAPHGER